MTEMDDLLNNLAEYLRNGRNAYVKNENNTAITLFFKALVTICDIHILQKTGAIPSSHENRFSILEEKFSFLYEIMDRDFPYYRESYRTITKKDFVELVKNDAEYLIKKLGLDKKIEPRL